MSKICRSIEVTHCVDVKTSHAQEVGHVLRSHTLIVTVRDGRLSSIDVYDMRPNSTTHSWIWKSAKSVIGVNLCTVGSSLYASTSRLGCGLLSSFSSGLGCRCLVAFSVAILLYFDLGYALLLLSRLVVVCLVALACSGYCVSLYGGP